MGFETLMRKTAPVLALAATIGLAGCGDIDININGEEGVPLAELDTDGATPDEVVLASSDTLVITTGEEFSISLDGSAEDTDAMRFILDGDTFGVMRDPDADGGSGSVTVNVTMAPPNSLVIAGSGRVSTDGMSDNPEVVLAGSGTANITGLAAERLEITMPGSGRVTAEGSADSLELTVAGSGSADMVGLTVGDAEVTIAGSGDASFASDGTVDGTIMGSGTIRVTGSATCTVETLGSGALICEEAEEAEAEAETEDA